MKWTCRICGYCHEGPEPPEKCPQCKVPADKFNKTEEPTDTAVAAPAAKWTCRICGFVHEGPEPPEKCPQCKVPADKFDKEEITAKWTCTICGFVHEGAEPPEKCPQCQVPADKFMKMAEGKTEWADQHVVGVAKGVDAEIIEGLRANFTAECIEVGMYLAMGRVAHREGYPEIGLYWEKAAWEEAEHAAKFAELLGEVLTDSTEKNLEMRIEAEAGACAGKKMLATRAKELNLDAIHDTVHEMAKDEARHGAAFEGLKERYFGKK